MTKLKTLIFLTLYCLIFSACSTSNSESKFIGKSFPVEDSLSSDQYTNTAIYFYNQSMFDESLKQSEKAIQINPSNATAYAIAAAVYSVQHKYAESIVNGEKAVELNSQIPIVADNLIYCYNQLEQWDKSEKLLEKILQKNPADNKAAFQLNEVKSNIQNSSFSSLVSKAIILILILCFGFFIYKNFSQTKLSTFNHFELYEFATISATISFVFYLIFYHFSTIIWSFNLKIPPAEVISPVRAYMFEHDGLEGYILYSLMFLNLVFSLAISSLIQKIKNKNLYVLILAGITIIPLLYFYKIGFYPPMSAMSSSLNLPLIFGIGLLTALLIITQNYAQKILLWIVLILLIPVCFISTGPISIFDYSFIFSPALRMIHGASLNSIYFQYDLLLSLLAFVWMKLNFDLNHFQVLGQLSFYLFFACSFIFARKFFSNKNMPVLFVVALVLARYYCVMDEPVSLFQITPLRLDLWIVLLMLVYTKGTYHWMVGCFVGLLVLVHKNFGLIYLISYSELLVTLFFADLITQDKFSFNSFKKIFVNHLSLIWKNFVIIIGFIMASVVLFKGFVAQSAILYQQVGIGMIQISTHSFYWYVPVLFGSIFILILKSKSKLPASYFASGLLILFVAIGNSMYFFGRSHEHNIINISGALIFCLFLLFDLAVRKIPVIQKAVMKSKVKVATPKKETPSVFQFNTIFVWVLPALFILSCSFFYTDRINKKIATQSDNFGKSQFIYSMPEFANDFSIIKKLTNNSPDVYFLNYRNDFLYYYYGNYTPVGYFNPCGSYILKNDLSVLLNELLDQNYYVVTTTLPDVKEIVSRLNYNSIITENGYTAISKKKVNFILPKSESEVEHIALNDTLGENGIDLKSIELKKDFTIELIVKPNSFQRANANILSNSGDMAGQAGFMIQQNNTNNNQYYFAYGGGKSWTQPYLFTLSENQFNYIVITVNNSIVKVFINGNLSGNGQADFQIKNSLMPLSISKGLDQKIPFNGLIKEIKITDGIISESAFSKNMEALNSTLK